MLLVAQTVPLHIAVGIHGFFGAAAAFARSLIRAFGLQRSLETLLSLFVLADVRRALGSPLSEK